MMSLRVFCSTPILLALLSCQGLDSDHDRASEAEDGGDTGESSAALAQAGLRGEYFGNQSLTGTPVVRTDATIDFDWRQGAPIAGLDSNFFSVRWTGSLTPSATATYKLRTLSDDGIRVWVDSTQVIDNWTPHAPTSNVGTVALTAGHAHAIRVEYFERTGGATARLFWSSPQLAEQVIPTTALRPDSATIQQVTFTPAAVPLSAPELVNPMRGQYAWHDNAAVPAGWPTTDSYYRWVWNDIEPIHGQYNWGLIDARVNAAKARHGRFGFRVMSLCQGCDENHLFNGARSAIPDDLAAVVNPMIATVPAGESDAGDKYLIPDWNDPDYLNRLQELLTAIGNRYKDEPHLGFVDISGYGNWGEIHMWPFEGAYATSPQKPLTAANAQRLVQMHASAFAQKLIVTAAGNKDVLAAAVASTSPPIGMRVDCLGADGLEGGANAIAAVPGAQHRWRTAPLLSEWCGFNPGSSGLSLFVQGLTQVRAYHVSTIGTNFRTPPANAEQSNAFRLVNVNSGYRLRPSSVTVGLNPDQPTKLAVRSTWANDGVAPTYLVWRVVISLKGPRTIEVPWTLNLKQVMPSPDPPLVDTETLTLPQALVPGVYSVALRVEDVQGVSPPMQLAIGGRDATGAHVLGTLTVP